jgi:hypothetical protein
VALICGPYLNHSLTHGQRIGAGHSILTKAGLLNDDFKALRTLAVCTLAGVFATDKELGYRAKRSSNLFDRIVRRRSPDLTYRLQHIPSKHNQPVHNQAQLLSGKEQEWSASTACRAQLFRKLCLRLRNSQYERTNRIGCEPNVIMLICLIH